MTGKPQISDQDLHGFIDGMLDSSRMRTVEAALSDDPVLAERAAKFADDRRMLKTVYGPLADAPVPEAWITLARGERPLPQAARPARSWWPLASAIAAGLLLALTFAGYWQMRSVAPGEIVATALAAREQAEQAAPDRQVIAVAADADIRQYDAALKNALAMKVKVPDLGRMGYRLAAIHLYGGHAAELLYRDRNHRLFTLYMRPSDGAARFDQFARGPLRICIWQDDQIGMVMAGDVSTAAMQRLASLAYTGLTL
jgi:anti-sigma factor RsiW